jgi:hypothetical protein
MPAGAAASPLMSRLLPQLDAPTGLHGGGLHHGGTANQEGGPSRLSVLVPSRIARSHPLVTDLRLLTRRRMHNINGTASALLMIMTNKVTLEQQSGNLQVLHACSSNVVCMVYTDAVSDALSRFGNLTVVQPRDYLVGHLAGPPAEICCNISSQERSYFCNSHRRKTLASQYRFLPALAHASRTVLAQPSLKWVVLVDDDSVVNVDRLVTALRGLDHTQAVFGGDMIMEGHEHAPFACGGAGSVFSRAAMARTDFRSCTQRLHNACLQSDWMIGMCARQWGVQPMCNVSCGVCSAFCTHSLKAHLEAAAQRAMQGSCVVAQLEMVVLHPCPLRDSVALQLGQLCRAAHTSLLAVAHGFTHCLSETAASSKAASFEVRVDEYVGRFFTPTPSRSIRLNVLRQLYSLLVLENRLNQPATHTMQRVYNALSAVLAVPPHAIGREASPTTQNDPALGEREPASVPHRCDGTGLAMQTGAIGGDLSLLAPTVLRFRLSLPLANAKGGLRLARGNQSLATGRSSDARLRLLHQIKEFITRRDLFLRPAENASVRPPGGTYKKMMQIQRALLGDACAPHTVGNHSIRTLVALNDYKAWRPVQVQMLGDGRLLIDVAFVLFGHDIEAKAAVHMDDSDLICVLSSYTELLVASDGQRQVDVLAQAARANSADLVRLQRKLLFLLIPLALPSSNHSLGQPLWLLDG